MKYGELTIIYDNDTQTDIFSKLVSWLNDIYNPIAEYIFLFEDGEIYKKHDNIKDFVNFNYIYTNGIFTDKLPSVIRKQYNSNNINDIIWFYKTPIKINDNENDKSYTLNFKNLFAGYNKYHISIRSESIYNCIYYKHKYDTKEGIIKPDIFGIMHIKSNKYKPRFIYAYDSNEYTKEEVMYLIIKLFNYNK